ncbi:adhesion G-protein coupled receptor D1-like [Ruditapes philippinarum]|uniref:adhesion G-protein coupled receptor D1-like n=1 Tax=Ruditapes philippinarum TaxID=129788 RepID=UPI00295AEE16|nr:adhesion G-protein coupled receptor D1-like [Ruditapes philippinarum]
MGVSWILGIFYVNDSFYFIQYIFAILNGLQGFFIFLFHCLLNKQVKNAIQLRNRRRSSVKETSKSTLRSTSKDERKSKDLKEPRKSFIDSGDFTTQNDSDDWKDKMIDTQYPSPDVKFATPLGFYGNGRRAATFSVESRDKLTGHAQTPHRNPVVT